MKNYNFKQYWLLSSSINTKFFNIYRTLTTYKFNDENFNYLIIGSLLGNSYMKKNKLDNSIIITFVKCSNNMEYLILFHKLLKKFGVLDPKKKLKLKKIISKNNKVLFKYSLDSYNLYNMDWLYKIFYKNNKKIVPTKKNLDKLLTPLSLSVWYLDIIPKELKPEISRFDIKNKDLENISYVFKNKYNIETTIILEKDIIAIYIKNTSKNIFIELIKPIILPSLEYKLKSLHNKFNLLVYKDKKQI